MKYKFWSAYYRLYAVWLAAKGCGRVHLGSVVVYQDKQYTVNNGVCSESWDLIDGSRKVTKAPRCECRRVWSIGEYCHAFRFTYRWWMSSYHRTSVEKRIYNWS